MRYFVTLYAILCITQLGIAQDPGDNHFNFVAGFPYLADNDNGEMTNIRYIGDTDQDGKGEFAYLTTNGDSCHFVIYEAVENDVYQIVYTYPFVPVPNGLFRDWTAIAVGDLNGNGVVEILVGLPVDMTGTVTVPNPPRLAVFEWAGNVGENMYGFDNGTTPNAIWNFDLPDNYSLVPFHFAIDDIDNDGTMELIADIREPKAVYVISQTESWDFPAWNIEWYLTNKTDDPNYVNHFDGGGLYGSGTGDLDNDGKKEIYVPVWDKWTLNIYECQAPGNFTRETYIRHVRPDADYGAVRGICIGDVNNDGVKELYIVGTDKDANGMGHVFAISNVTDVSLVDSASVVDIIIYPTHPNNTTARAARTAILTDIDNDGNADIISCGEGNGLVYDFEYKGSGDPLDPNSWTFIVAFDLWQYWATYLPPETISQLTPRFWDMDVCYDMDGDGHNEFVVINYSADQLIVPDDPWFYIIEEGPPTAVDNYEIANVAKTFVLYNNYPNPFNPTTTIKYSVPKLSHISLNIYNLLGEEVKTLIDSEVPAGVFEIVWDGTNNAGSPVSSGTYLYRLATGTHTYTRVMTLTK